MCLLLQLLYGISISSKILYIDHLWRSEVPAPLKKALHWGCLSLSGAPEGR